PLSKSSYYSRRIPFIVSRPQDHSVSAPRSGRETTSRIPCSNTHHSTTRPLTTSRLTRFPQKITVERVVQLHGLSCSGGSHVCAPMVGADFRALSGPLSSPSALARAFGQSTGARRTYLRPPRGQTCFFRGRQSARDRCGARERPGRSGAGSRCLGNEQSSPCY